MSANARGLVPRLVLAAPGTGQGKTTVAAAVMALLAEQFVAAAASGGHR